MTTYLHHEPLDVVNEENIAPAVLASISMLDTLIDDYALAVQVANDLPDNHFASERASDRFDVLCIVAAHLGLSVNVFGHIEDESIILDAIQLTQLPVKHHASYCPLSDPSNSECLCF
jgi:hypothetical protein